MVKKWQVTIPSLTGREKRKVYLYLPNSYRYDYDRHYPVLYMFDGHNVFFDDEASYGKSWGMKHFMDSTHTQLIIVGIECNHHPNNGRLMEYSPYDFYEEEVGLIKGKGKLTMDWIISYLKPFIDRHYRTIWDREHTFLAGSSMGGLMTVYGLLHYNRYFSRGAALSPSLWIDVRKATKMIQDSHPDPNTILYMDYGSEEMNNHTETSAAFGQMASLLLSKEVMLDCRIVPGGDHSEASWERQIPFFMNTLMYGIDD